MANHEHRRVNLDALGKRSQLLYFLIAPATTYFEQQARALLTICGGVFRLAESLQLAQIG